MVRQATGRCASLNWSIRGALLIFLIAVALLGTGSTAQANEIQVSETGSQVGSLALAGSWVACEDYRTDPATIRWRNLDSGATGSVAVPDLGRRGTPWALGKDFLVWAHESGGSEVVFAQRLTTGDKWTLTYAGQPLTSFVRVVGTTLYWWGDGQDELRPLHGQDLVTGATRTWLVPFQSMNLFDIAGDWYVWVEWLAFDPGPEDFDSATGSIQARHLKSGETITLGPAIWGNTQADPPRPDIDGDWVVWDTAVSVREWNNTVLYAYDLAKRERRTLVEEDDPESNACFSQVSKGWVAWQAQSGSNIRSYFRPLDAASARPHPVSHAVGQQYFPKLDYPWLVWMDNRSGNYEVYARHVSMESQFTDVTSPDEVWDWPTTAIYTLAKAGVVQGYDDGTFRPDNPVLRAQLARMLVGALGLEVRDGAIRSTFVDVPAGPPSDPLYPDDYVAVAAANGIVQGFSSSSFGPYQPVTRIQMVSMVVRALERLRPGRLEKPASDWKPQFPEATDPTHGENVRLAEYNGLLSHWGHSYPWEELHADLWDPATRGEMALILWWALGGELPPLREPMKSEMTLPELRDHLLRTVQSTSLIYLPTQLPSSWALLKDGCQVWKAGDGYGLAFTDGHSTVYLQWPYEGDGALGGFHHTGVSWEGREIVAGYSHGLFCCFVDGWDHWYWLSGDPWNREVVLALAASMEWMRGTMSPGG